MARVRLPREARRGKQQQGQAAETASGEGHGDGDGFTADTLCDRADCVTSVTALFLLTHGASLPQPLLCGCPPASSRFFSFFSLGK